MGRHRVQMDVQQLPTVAGGQGFEYKISLIHLRTRMKYSEIHRQCTSRIVADVFERALLRLPPFFQIWTDNAMIFTMEYSTHPERFTTFEQHIQAHGLLHTLIAKGSPWRNGFIERSNRTDNDEFFHYYCFTSSEERRYYFRLWEDYYNHWRPHQGLDNQTPAHHFAADYPFHAAHRYLT